MSESLRNYQLNNRLLASLSRVEYERLIPDLEPVRLAKGRVLIESGEPVRDAYFIQSGAVSLLSITEGGDTVEVAMVGREGAVGIPAVLRRGKAPYRAQVQLAATALQVEGEVLKREFRRGRELQDLLLHYTHSSVAQIAQTVACVGFHAAEERLARWLLIAGDRAAGDTFHLTRDDVAAMLGVHRNTIDAAVNALRREGLIRYGRGELTILDRQGLETAACECYRVTAEDVGGFLTK